MFEKNYSRLICFFVISLICFATARAQPTEFTYQGRLLFGGVPANGSHDFEFRLFRDFEGSQQVGTVISLNGVNVDNGVFSVRLDFGNQFPGANRFLEIRVRQTGQEFFTVLTPLQAITSAPYAIKSINAENAVNAITANNAGRLGGLSSTLYVLTTDFRLSDARNPLPNSPNYIQNTTNQQPLSSFNISGNGTVGGTISGNVVNATREYSINGVKVLSATAPYSAGGVVIFASNTFVGESAGLSSTHNPDLTASTGKLNSFFGANAGKFNTTGSYNSFFGVKAGEKNTDGFRNSFFGTSAGERNMDGSNNSFFGAFAGFSNTTGDDNSFFGEFAGFGNTSGSRNVFLGNGAGVRNAEGSFNTIVGKNADVGANNLINATAIGARAFVGQSNSLVLGSISGINGANTNTNVGIGTTTPTSKLTVAGSGAFNASGAARFDLLNTTANTSYFLHVVDNGRWQLGTGNLTRILVEPNGNVGIGTGAADKLQVLGDIRVGTSGSNGCLKNSGGGAIAGSCSSDIRLKKSITNFPSTLELFAKLRPVNFYWKKDEFPERSFGEEQSFGLIAQEVEEVLPELVSEDEQGFKTVNYSKLPILMLQAIKELKAENNLLKQEMQKGFRHRKDQIMASEKIFKSQQKQIDEQKEIIRRQQAEFDGLKKFICAQNPSAEFCQPKN